MVRKSGFPGRNKVDSFSGDCAMKKYPFLTALLSLIIFCGSVSARTFYAGALGGLNYTDMDVTIRQNKFNVDSRPELMIGVILGKHFDPNISLQIESLYLKRSGVLETGEMDYDINLMFSSLQLSALLKTSLGDRIRPYVLAGPTVGYVFSSKLAADAGLFRFNWDIMEITRRWEPALEWGAGMQIMSGESSFFLEMRFNYGISNLLKEGNLDYTAGNSELLQLTLDDQDRLKTKGWRILTGFTIPFGK
jgi:hypothetical protein